MQSWLKIRNFGENVLFTIAFVKRFLLITFTNSKIFKTKTYKLRICLLNRHNSEGLVKKIKNQGPDVNFIILSLTLRNS